MPQSGLTTMANGIAFLIFVFDGSVWRYCLLP